ncbi:hypothetical protein GF373_15630 [bacterium]|nr:hypothetical protein [bacterium]
MMKILKQVFPFFLLFTLLLIPMILGSCATTEPREAGTDVPPRSTQNEDDRPTIEELGGYLYKYSERRE